MTLKPNRWKCDVCGHISQESELLVGKSPFRDDDDVVGCPKCRMIPNFIEMCDECDHDAACGTPIEGGYRRTCGEHRPITQADTDLVRNIIKAVEGL